MFQEIERKMRQKFYSKMFQDVNKFYALTLIYRVEVTYGFIQKHISIITDDYQLIMM